MESVHAAVEWAAPVDDSFVFEGRGSTNLEYASWPRNGPHHWSSEVFNCSAPDTGNMEVLNRYGTRSRKTNGCGR